MDRVKASLASIPRIAPVLLALFALMFAACKGGGSSGY
jgi:hypothetical protein